MGWVRDVPSCFTGAQAHYLAEIVDALNRVPVFSFFSGITPESVITGVAGNFALNLGTSASSLSLLFVKSGSPTVASRVSWCRMSIATLA